MGGCANARGLALALAVFSLSAPATAQPTEAERAAQADAAAIDAYVAAQRQQQETTTPAADAPSANVSPADAPSESVSLVARWVTGSGDNKGLPFIIIDKVGAQVFVFDAQSQPLGEAPALIGTARGDDSVPGVGERELRKIPVADRTTPAGRFVAKFGRAGGGHSSVLWVDYGTAVSLHPVITANLKEHRMQRIKSLTPDDNRITFGCINVPARFYAKVVRPLFKQKAGGVVYILPDTKPLTEVFPNLRLLQQAAL